MGSAGASHFPVIIVGAGPVGFLTATNIAKQGIKVLVLERWDQVDQSPRAASYQPCAQAELLESGTFEDVKKHSIINDIVTFWFEGERKAFIRKSEGGSIFPSGINCPQPKLAEILQEHLLTRYDAEVRFCQKVTAIQDTGDLVNVTAVNSHTDVESQYTCEWLVGADGAGSAVRKFAKIDFEGFSWPKEDFVATNITGYPFEKYGFTTANMVMHPVHWAVVTVLDATPIWRIAFGVRAGMTNDEIRAEVDEHYKHIFPDWPGPGYKLVELNKYKPHQRCASTFRKGRICLAGDAAHSNNPIGGLGLTTGILDAGPLGRGLAAVINSKAPSSLLDKWAAARREKWLNYTNGFSIENKRIIQRGGYSDDPLGIWQLDDVAREHGMEKWLEGVGPEKRQADIALYKRLEDPAAQLASRMQQWDITIDPRWMEEYEDAEVVKLRISLRPEGYHG